MTKIEANSIKMKVGQVSHLLHIFYVSKEYYKKT